MKVITGLKYSKTHEWVKLEGNKAYIGITDHAQHALGDLVFIEVPKTGQKIEAGRSLCVAESVKAASDVYSPVSGTIVDVNEVLADSPEKINEAPYDSWIVAVEISNEEEIEKLMEAREYEKFCAEEA